MSRLKDEAGTTHQKIKKIGLLDPENSTVVSESQSTAINVCLMIGNIVLTIATIVAISKFGDILVSALIIFGVCFSNMGVRIMANMIQRHDMMINIAKSLREEYSEEKDKIIKQQTEAVKKYKNYNKPIYDPKRLEIFKREVHKVALERIEDEDITEEV